MALFFGAQIPEFFGECKEVVYLVILGAKVVKWVENKAYKDLRKHAAFGLASCIFWVCAHSSAMRTMQFNDRQLDCKLSEQVFPFLPLLFLALLCCCWCDCDWKA